MDEDNGEEKDIYLLKRDMLSKDHFKGMRSKGSETFSKTIPPNADLELQSSNELIEGIRSVSLKPLKQDHRGPSHSA